MSKTEIVLTIVAINGAFANAFGDGRMVLAGAVAAALGFAGLAILDIRKWRQSKAQA